ncbi:hypothetical protein KM043_010348 [Ampulex compressa]|nr:hypothetical protein KM043_010348 [Ampulex compressa]
MTAVMLTVGRDDRRNNDGIDGGNRMEKDNSRKPIFACSKADLEIQRGEAGDGVLRVAVYTTVYEPQQGRVTDAASKETGRETDFDVERKDFAAGGGWSVNNRWRRGARGLKGGGWKRGKGGRK